MRLLVSVRCAAEVGAALAGGADIIDAKEPERGPLGPVSAQVLAELLSRIPKHRAASIALGDLTTADEVLAAISPLPLASRPAPLYLKLGFAGVSAPEQIQALIMTAVAASSKQPVRPHIVPVAYADFMLAGTAAPDTIGRVAARSGATGVLLDTYTKNGRSLFTWIGEAALAQWVGCARRAGLASAVAGGLDLKDLEAVCMAAPDVVGVRGAACEGGRQGRVTSDRVRALRRRIHETSGSLQGPDQALLEAGSRNA
ncbi:MAG TPA: (5-formylfuran-3-yl)methyl phosphate synthase [Gemmatimonadales bacterium]